MTEAEWFTTDWPAPLMNFVAEAGSCRKMQLCAVACCVVIWDLLTDERFQNFVRVSEREADDLATEAELSEAYDQVRDYQFPDPSYATADAAWAFDVLNAVRYTKDPYPKVAPGVSALSASDAARLAGQGGRRLLMCSLVRDIFGNPFRPVTVDPAWHTATVVSLAEAIYADRAFDRLPILADALEDAGCGNADILAHCRQPSPTEHVRGCWVVDLVLGKS